MSNVRRLEARTEQKSARLERIALAVQVYLAPQRKGRSILLLRFSQPRMNGQRPRKRGRRQMLVSQLGRCYA